MPQLITLESEDYTAFKFLQIESPGDHCNKAISKETAMQPHHSEYANMTKNNFNYRSTSIEGIQRKKHVKNLGNTGLGSMGEGGCNPNT